LKQKKHYRSLIVNKTGFIDWKTTSSSTSSSWRSPPLIVRELHVDPLSLRLLGLGPSLRRTSLYFYCPSCILNGCLSLDSTPRDLQHIRGREERQQPPRRPVSSHPAAQTVCGCTCTHPPTHTRPTGRQGGMEGRRPYALLKSVTQVS